MFIFYYVRYYYRCKKGIIIKENVAPDTYTTNNTLYHERALGESDREREREREREGEREREQYIQIISGDI